MKKNRFLDIVVGGPDMSGTSTQINDILDFFSYRDNKIRDLRGTDIDVLFHAEKFKFWNRDYRSLSEFADSNMFNLFVSWWIVNKSHKLLSVGNTNCNLRVGSFVKNDITTYINPESADVWILEEPTKRHAGLVNRVIEQNRSKFGSDFNPVSAALNHQSYRTSEFLLYRGPLRDAGKIIVRSRSEESACYQIYDKEYLLEGISVDDYLALPGHDIAFKYPPTHIFIVSAPVDWTKEEYLKLKSVRSKGRLTDDHENKADYQLLVNRRYSSEWIDELYEKGCKMHGGKMPKIIKIGMYDSDRKEHCIKHIRRELFSYLSDIVDDKI